jgi:hypothetical protein
MLPASLVRRLAFEIAQLLLHVLGVLTGDARDLVLPDEAAQVAHWAEKPFSEIFLPASTRAASGLKCDRQRLLRCKEIAERNHVVATQDQRPWATSRDRCAYPP